MVRKDIVIGLKNAVERGASIEQARNILINSGYSENDVKEAYNYLTGNSEQLPPVQKIPDSTVREIQKRDMFAQQSQQTQASTQPIPQINQVQPIQQPNQEKIKKPFPWAVVLLSTVLILLIILLGVVVYFRQDIGPFVQKLLGQ